MEDMEYDGAAAPSSTPALQETCEAIGMLVTCKLCGRRFPSRRGLSQHERKAHAESYHREHIPVVLRRGYSQEESVLVAREELRLVGIARAKGVTTRVNANADLCRAFPHRSLKSIKGLRKNVQYTLLVRRLEHEERENPPTEPLGSPVRVETDALVERKWHTPEPKSRRGPKVRWSEELMEDVAWREAQLSLEGCRDLNRQLSIEFPCRTLEAIKGQRRLPKYRCRVERHLELLELHGTSPEMVRSPPEQGSSVVGEQSPTDKLDRLSSVHGPAYDCGDTPPVPPCNPGRLSASRSVRDGDAVGGRSLRFRCSSGEEVIEDEVNEGDVRSPTVVGLAESSVDSVVHVEVASVAEDECGEWPRAGDPRSRHVIPGGKT